MIETLLGGLLGGAFRLAPEILKWLDRQGERGHELAMQDKALEFDPSSTLCRTFGRRYPVTIRVCSDCANRNGQM
jgi:hypothetical protein